MYWESHDCFPSEAFYTYIVFKNGEGWRYVKPVASIYQEGTASTTKSIIYADKEDRMIFYPQ